MPYNPPFTKEELVALRVKYPNYYSPCKVSEAMPDNIKAAVAELNEIGAPVYGSAYGSIFSIGAEPRTGGDKLFADYYSENCEIVEHMDGDKVIHAFGVHESVNEILTKHGLMSEWGDPGTLCVNKF